MPAVVHQTVTRPPVAQAARAKRTSGLRGPRGYRGRRGPTGPKGPTGPTGAAGPYLPVSGMSGFETPFDAVVQSNTTETITVGQFTLRENAGSGGACATPTLQDNSAYSAMYAAGAGAAFAPLASATPTAIGTLLGGGANNLFAATLINSSSEVTGDVSYVSISGQDACVTAGFMGGQ